MVLDRRRALVVVGALVGFLKGHATAAAQGTQMLLALDGTDTIMVQYHGRRAAITPNELLDALGATPIVPPTSQMYRGK